MGNDIIENEFTCDFYSEFTPLNSPIPKDEDLKITAEETFENAVTYMKETIRTKSCRVHEGAIVTAIWNDEISAFKNIWNSNLLQYLVESVLINSNNNDESDFEVSILQDENLGSSPSQEELSSSLTVLKQARKEKICLWNIGYKATLVLKAFEKEYDTIFVNHVQEYIFRNILLPKYGISKPIETLEPTDKELDYIRRHKYNYYKEVEIKEFIPISFTNEIQSVAKFINVIPNISDEGEKLILIDKFKESACSEPFKEIYVQVLNLCENHINQEETCFDTSTLETSSKIEVDELNLMYEKYEHLSFSEVIDLYYS